MNKQEKGLTLIELQIATILMIVVLITAGMIFYFSLSTLKYIQDAFIVQANAQTAIRAISSAIIPANRYGWSPGPPAWGPGQFGQDSVYGVSGPEQACWGNFLILTLAGADASTQLVLRRDGNAAGTVFTPTVYNDDQLITILRNAANELSIDGTVVATNIFALTFRKIDFNCVDVELEAQGNIPDPLSATQQYNIVRLRTRVTLHCAQSRICEIWPAGSTQW